MGCLFAVFFILGFGLDVVFVIMLDVVVIRGGRFGGIWVGSFSLQVLGVPELFCEGFLGFDCYLGFVVDGLNVLFVFSFLWVFVCWCVGGV